jgi:hypothetical protein
MAEYRNTSLYSTTLQENGALGILDFKRIPKFDTDVEYTILSQYNYRPDLLASDLYDDPELWWVFKARNPTAIDDPIFDFVAGVTIKIPTINTIRSVVGGV